MTWKEILCTQNELDYFRILKEYLKRERSNKIVYPSEKNMFNAFKLTPFEDIKVIILGQDPYHGKDQANGLCFSVSDGINTTPSLINIFKEIKSDVGTICTKGNLEYWGKQGVFLLNATLTVRSGEPGSHQNKGWEIFTDFVIQEISEKKEKVVFILWGRFAQNKSYLIDTNKHYVLKAAHPSPYSANNGFFGCKHFSKCNLFLKENGIKEIDWTT